MDFMNYINLFDTVRNIAKEENRTLNEADIIFCTYLRDIAGEDPNIGEEEWGIILDTYDDIAMEYNDSVEVEGLEWIPFKE